MSDELEQTRVAMKNKQYQNVLMHKLVELILRENDTTPSWLFKTSNEKFSGEVNKLYSFYLMVKYEDYASQYIHCYIKFDDIFMQDGGNPNLKIKLFGFLNSAPKHETIFTQEMELFSGEWNLIDIPAKIIHEAQKLYKTHLGIYDDDTQTIRDLRKGFAGVKKLKEDAQEELEKVKEKMENIQVEKRSLEQEIDKLLNDQYDLNCEEGQIKRKISELEDGIYNYNNQLQNIDNRIKAEKGK